MLKQTLNYCVYRITSPSGKFYFGYTCDFNARMRQHKNRSKKIRSKFYNSVIKYGWDNHKKEIIFQSDCKNSALEFESSVISIYKNTLNTAEGGIGGIRSEEHRKSISLALKKARTNSEYKVWRKYNLEEVYIKIKPLIEIGCSESEIIAKTGYSKGTIYRAKKKK